MSCPLRVLKTRRKKEVEGLIFFKFLFPRHKVLPSDCFSYPHRAPKKFDEHMNAANGQVLPDITWISFNYCGLRPFQDNVLMDEGKKEPSWASSPETFLLGEERTEGGEMFITEPLLCSRYYVRCFAYFRSF